MGSGSATGVFSGSQISAFFAEYIFLISVVILNSTLHYQIFKFDINIQILVWIFGSGGGTILKVGGPVLEKAMISGDKQNKNKRK